MAKRNNIDFQQWVQENNLSENDLLYIQKAVRNKTLLWFFGGSITLPLFLRSWSTYKIIKQRTFEPRLGFFYCLYNLAMFITFIMIIPIVIFLATSNYMGGMKGLMKKGLVGAGEQSVVRRQQWKKICNASRKIRLLISFIVAIGISILVYSTSKQPLDMTQDIIMPAVAVFILFDVIGLIISSIINNIRYKQYLRNEG